MTQAVAQAAIGKVALKARRFAIGLPVFGIIAALLAAYFGAFGQTGADYFRACWKKNVAARNLPDGQDPMARDADEAIAWADCDYATNKAIFARGIVFVARWAEQNEPALYAACPDASREVPGPGNYFITIKLVVDAGGLQLIDRFLPADYMIGRVWTERWPQCAAVRQRVGFPMVVETSDHHFTLERPVDSRR
jgi:hypothetical protein